MEGTHNQAEEPRRVCDLTALPRADVRRAILDRILPDVAVLNLIGDAFGPDTDIYQDLVTIYEVGPRTPEGDLYCLNEWLVRHGWVFGDLPEVATLDTRHGS
jgi:hypothetical protein